MNTNVNINSLWENLTKKSGIYYCAICNIDPSNPKGFASHVQGRKHQLQLKRIEKAGLEKFARKEAKKIKRRLKKIESEQIKYEQSEQRGKKKKWKKHFVDFGRPNRVLKIIPAEEKQNSSEGEKNEGSERESKDDIKNEAPDSELSSSNYTQLTKVFHSEVLNDGGSGSFLEKVPVVLPGYTDQTENLSVLSPSSCFPKMDPYDNLPRFSRRAPLRQSRYIHPLPDFHRSWKDGRHPYWQHYPPPPPPPFNYHERLQHHRGLFRRPFFHPPGMGASAYPQQPFCRSGMNGGEVPSQDLKDAGREEGKSRHDDHRHISPLGSDDRHSAEKHKDGPGESYGSRFQSNFCHKSTDNRRKYDDGSKATEDRSAKNIRNGKLQMGHTVKLTGIHQSKTETNRQQHANKHENLPRRNSVPDLKPIDCTKARSSASRSGDLSTAKGPTFSNVVMQRMNSRLHSFTKYGKMPTSGQIRHLALSSASSAQGKADGKLQQWSKKIKESHHNLSAEDKELINRLVNYYPCSQGELKKLECCIREHARSRKKLTLPRFNLALSGMETSKDPPCLDDNVSSMITEVVDCLPEDVLNSLINALNSDADEHVTVDFDVDAHLPVPSEEESGMSLDIKYSEKSCDNVFVTVDEVGGHTSCEETEESQQEPPNAVHLTSCSSIEKSAHSSSPKDQVQAGVNSVANHTYPVKLEQPAHGFSPEVCKSKKIPDERNPCANKQENVSSIAIKKEPPEQGNESTEKEPDHVEYNGCTANANLVATQSSCLDAISSDLGSAYVRVKNEKSDDSLDIKETSPVASSCGKTFSSSSHTISMPEAVAPAMPVSAVTKSPGTCKEPLKSVSVDAEFKEPGGGTVSFILPDAIPLGISLLPSSCTRSRKEYPTTVGKLNSAEKTKQSHMVQSHTNGTPEATVEQREEKGSRTITLGISLLSAPTVFNKDSNKHIVGCSVNDKNASLANLQNKKTGNIVNGYPGLSWITKSKHEAIVKTPGNSISSKTSEVENNSTGTVFTSTQAPSQNNSLQDATLFYSNTSKEFEDSINSSVHGPTIFGIQPCSKNWSQENDHVQDAISSLPKICSVTTIKNSEDTSDCYSASLDACSVVQVKQEPLSPPQEEVNASDQNNTDVEKENASKNCKAEPAKTQVTGSSCSATSISHSNGSHYGVEPRGIAAAFPGVLHKVKPSSQIEDTNKTPEVSSSTSTTLLDEVQPASLIELKSSHRSAVSGKDGTSLDLIRDLLAITSAEEELVQQVREAEHTITQLTASLDEWRHKKHEIEQKQMKLRMKRQELLLSAAQGAMMPYDRQGNTSLESVSTSSNRASEHSNSLSDEEQHQPAVSRQSSPTSSVEEFASESDSNCSQSLSRTHCTLSDTRKREKRKRNLHNSLNAKHRLRLKMEREQRDETVGNSTATFLNNRASKRKNLMSSSKDDLCSPSDRNRLKKKCLGVLDAKVVLQPFQLKHNTDSKNFVANEADDIIVLKDTPCRSVETKEEVELDSSDEEPITIPDEGPTSGHEDVISPSTEFPELTVNIGVLVAHTTAVVDMKVYDGYLYSCSLDCTAKRFSLVDPFNDIVSYKGHTKTVTSICLSPCKEVYTTCHDKYLRCYEANTGVNTSSFEMKNGITCSCDGGGTLYLGLTSGEVIFFNFLHKKQINELTCASCAIGQLATITQGAQRLLCVAANDGIVSLYDTSTSLLLRCLEGRVQPPCCIQICNDSVYITTSEKSIVIHDLLSGKLERMLNWAASATGLEIIDNYVLTSSYDGLIRCHKRNQNMVFHSIYYGAGKAMVMSMTSYKGWVFTGNRKGIIEAFKFDPSKQLSCQYGRCRQNFGRECDVLHHVTTEHLPLVSLKTKTCPWRACSYTFTPRTILSEKQMHVKEHLTSVQ